MAEAGNLMTWNNFKKGQKTKKSGQNNERKRSE